MSREYGPVIVQGRQLHCIVCGNGTFWEHRIQLHTPLLTFLDLEAWDRVAQCAICEHCGFIHWFMPPTAMERDSENQAVPESN